MTISPSASNSASNAPEARNQKHQAAIKNADYQQLDRNKLTPMMRHYTEVKDQYPHTLLLYRVGDFFECFFQDAIVVARELELVLTSKEGGKEIGRVPMTGVPHHAVERYSSTLLEKGFCVAICDQTEDAKDAEAEKRMVDRQITRVLTPGTLIESGMLDARSNNFLAAAVVAGEHWGLAYADISTGEFLTTQDRGIERLAQELLRLSPAEVLVPTNAPDPGKLLRPGETSEHLPEGLPASFCYSLRSPKSFYKAAAYEALIERFNLKSLEGLGCEQLPLAIRAAGGLLKYLEDTFEQQGRESQQKSQEKENTTPPKVPLQVLRTYTLTDYLILDHQTRRNLEILQTVRDGSLHGSLLWALDKTRTPMGGRALRRWLLQPLLEVKGIEARQDTIAELLDDSNLREELQDLLREVYDLERLTGRAGAGTANARDLYALSASLTKVVQLATVCQRGQSPYLQVLHAVPVELEQLGETIRQHLVDNPPIHVKEGGLIRDGVNADLDDYRTQVEADRQWIANLEASERERTGIANLRVGFNKTFGYYISLPRSKAEQAPEDYIRKQTLTNEERYITPDLKEREARILTAQDDLNRLEYEIFTQLRSTVGDRGDKIRQVAKAVAALDVLCGLAEIAGERKYCRPQMLSGREITILAGRHPVVERSIPDGFFVPNSVRLGTKASGEAETTDNPRPDLIVLTGPNASGKSCYLRQVGLIQLMAQTGSFVPADKAVLGICDRIFTRVGAVDDLATGQSTFMVEMNETANILNHATDNSLVLLDEIGRGTATFDGLSIAWAVAEHLAMEIQARTIFATHYHELNELASILPNVANYQVTVKELRDRIVFLHQVQPGGADRSYGIEAGRLAGLPAPVISRARQVMGQIEKHSKLAVGLRKGGEMNRQQSPKTAKQSPEEEVSQQQLDIDIFS
jgi:DNA mismatch repair protein MutS